MLCPDCLKKGIEHKMHKAGSGASGRTEYQRYRCYRCRRTVLNTNEPYIREKKETTS